MRFAFKCPECQQSIDSDSSQVGHRIPCPSCGRKVPVTAPGTSTVTMVPPTDDHERTVMLEAVEVTEAIDAPAAVEVTVAVEQRAPTANSGSSATGADVAADEMPFRIERRHADRDAGIDMTPMVDVTFLLLIFFMVTATFTLQRSLEIPKIASDDPSTTVVNEEQTDQSDFVTVVVDEFSTYQVLTVDWDREAPSVQDLHSILRAARGGDRTGTVPTKLRVEPHGDALHEKVVAAIDAGSASGFEEVLLVPLIDG